MANTRKPPKGEFCQVKISGTLIDAGRQVTVSLFEHQPFKIAKNELGGVFYMDGTWGYGLLKPGGVFREIQLIEKVARERGFA
jgi:hypothetical protein